MEKAANLPGQVKSTQTDQSEEIIMSIIRGNVNITHNIKCYLNIESVWKAIQTQINSHLFMATTAMKSLEEPMIIWVQNTEFCLIKDHPSTCKFKCNRRNEDGSSKIREYHFIRNSGKNLGLSPMMQSLQLREGDFQLIGAKWKRGHFKFQEQNDEPLAYLELEHVEREDDKPRKEKEAEDLEEEQSEDSGREHTCNRVTAECLHNAITIC